MFEIAPMSQNDPLWKDKLIGTSSQKIGRWGCLLTCLAMVINHLLGLDLTPASLNDMLVEAGLLTGSDVIPGRISQVIHGIILEKFVTYDLYANMREIDETLLSGKPVIVQVDRSTVLGLQSHFVVIYRKVKKDYLIRDPFPYPVETGEVFLHKRYGFFGDNSETIKGVIILRRAYYLISGGNNVQKD